MLAAITTTYRLSIARTHSLLGFALALQIIDMSGMMIAIRGATVRAGTTHPWLVTRDSRWDGVIASARDVTFAPDNLHVGLNLYQEVAWRAVSAGKPVRIVYASRNSRATEARIAREQIDFGAGRLDPQRLYVLFPQAQVPKDAQSRLLVLDGVRLIVPADTAQPRKTGSF